MPPVALEKTPQEQYRVILKPRRILFDWVSFDLQIELSFWKICDEGIEKLVVYSPNIDRVYSSSELGKLDFRTRTETGFTYSWIDNELCYVKISDTADLKKLAKLLEISKKSVKKLDVNVTEEYWNHIIPRLVYQSIREAAARKSPGKVWLKGKNNQIFIPELKPRNFPEGLMHGLEFLVYRVNVSGLAIAVDYISHQSDDTIEQRSELLSPSERSTMIDNLMNQVVPASGLSFCFGGNDLLFPHEQVGFTLVGDDL